MSSTTLPKSHNAVAGLTTDPIPSGFFTRIKRMCTRFPVRDTSYLTTVSFTIGAAFFAVNGFFYVLQTTQPDTYFSTENTIATPVTSCIGDAFFFLGCTMAILEALNAGRSHVDGSRTGMEDTHVETGREHVQASHEKGGPAPWPMESAVVTEKSRQLEDGSTSLVTTSAVALIGSPEFIWIPSMRDLLGYYIHDLAFVAAVISWTGIIFFTIATIAYIPGVANLESTTVYYYLALLPTFLGGFFFLVAAIMQTTLTQRKWYIPALNRLSWYVGFWNSVGSLGFALGGCLWYAGESAYWSATLASFWGAWGWFIGSSIGWYIVMDNYP